jgi:hypothetical protein
MVAICAFGERLLRTCMRRREGMRKGRAILSPPPAQEQVDGMEFEDTRKFEFSTAN